MNIRLFFKLIFVIIISFLLSFNFDYGDSAIINYEFMLNALLSFFGVALAITAIFFTVLDRLRHSRKNDFDIETLCNPILSEMIDNVKGLLLIIIAYFSINLLDGFSLSINSFINSKDKNIKNFSIESFFLLLGLILTLLIIYDITISIGKLIKVMMMFSNNSTNDSKHKELSELTKTLDDEHFKKLLDYFKKLVIEQEVNKNPKNASDIRSETKYFNREDNKMLDDKDLQTLQVMLETVIDARVEKTEKLIEDRVEQSENLLLEELSRTQNILEKRIETVNKNLDELSQYHRITKLENENTTILLQMINDLRKEIDEIKQKIA